MIKLKEMSKAQLKETYEIFKKEYEQACKLGINLDISRGKPNGAQLDLSNGLMTCLDKSVIDNYSFDYHHSLKINQHYSYTKYDLVFLRFHVDHLSQLFSL